MSNKDDEPIITKEAPEGTKAWPGPRGDFKKDRDRARTLAIFAEGTKPGVPIENPPKQTCPFWCVFCGDPFPSTEELGKHWCKKKTQILITEKDQ